MTRKGRWLEKVVAAIEGGLLHARGQVVDIQSPGFLPDKHSGTRREHDVLVTMTLGHHLLTVAIECRDRRRKLGGDEVEAFAAKCHATGVSNAVMVSRRGFRPGALKKALANNIECFLLTDTESLPWFAPDTPAVFTNRKLVACHLQFRAHCEHFALKELIDYEGNAVDMDGYKRRAGHSIPNEVLNERPRLIRARVPNPQLRIRDPSSGECVEVDDVLIKFIFEYVDHPLKVTLLSYTKPGSGTAQLAEAAILQAPTGMASVALVKNPDDELVMVLQHGLPEDALGAVG